MRHQDFTWTVPLSGLCLYAIEVPDDGGDTVFYNAELALTRLDPALRRRAESLRAVHFDRFAAAREHKAVAALEAERPVVMAHPATGRSILFVNEQTTKCLKDDDSDCGDDTLGRLLSAFDDLELQYAHHWRAGDVIVWDNLSIQHSRTAFPSDQPRTIRRVQID
jgi:taurine dioxygenase